VVLAVQGDGDVFRINLTTGAASTPFTTGIQCNAATSYTIDGGRQGRTDYILLGGGQGPQADQILTSTGAVYLNTTARPPGYGIRGMAIAGGWNDFLYVILSADDPTTIDILATITYWGAYTVIGPTGRADLEALATSPTGILYALGTGNSGQLYTLNTSSGAAIPIGSGGIGTGSYALGFLPDGTLLACGQSLLSVSTSTGAATLIGPTGYPGFRGLPVFTFCYPNCNQGGPPPMLNVADFSCFLGRFAVESAWPPAQQINAYTNCDQSTTPPILNVADFTCFLQSFAAGCSAP
jgi:hypothetical protein